MKGIIEGEYSRLPLELYEKFKNDYLTSPLTSDEVRKKYGLSEKEYSQLTKPIRDELGIKTRPYPNSKYFYRQGNRWWIVKSINGERIIFGSLPTSFFSEDDMVKVIKNLKKMGWTPTLGKEYIEELNNKCHLI